MLRDHFHESMADALASRKAAQVSGPVVVAWMAFLRHAGGSGPGRPGPPGRLVRRGVIVVVTMLIALIIHRRSVLADPLPLQPAPSDLRGIGTDRGTYATWVMMTVIHGGLLYASWDVLPLSGRWGMGLFALAMIAMTVSASVPGLIIRRHKWEILEETLRTNPAAAAKYREHCHGLTYYQHRPPSG